MAYNIVLNKKECEIDGVKCAFSKYIDMARYTASFLFTKKLLHSTSNILLKGTYTILIITWNMRKNVQQQQKHFWMDDHKCTDYHHPNWMLLFFQTTYLLLGIKRIWKVNGVWLAYTL